MIEEDIRKLNLTAVERFLIDEIAKLRLRLRELERLHAIDPEDPPVWTPWR